MDVIARPTPLADLFVIEVLYHQDERGFFMEAYNQREFARLGIIAPFVQDNHSRSGAKVLRGLHYQDQRAPTAKLIRCSQGAIFDVAVDIRAGSSTFGQWYGLTLSAENKLQLYVPVGFAHGFVVLGESAEVQYKVTEFYAPAAEGVIAWDDPEIGIDWPVDDPLLSARDRVGRPFADYRANPAFRIAG